MEKQTRKQVETLKYLKLFNKTDELKQIENIFPQKQLTGLVTDKLKKIRKLQNKIKLDDLEYTAKRGKHYNFSKYLLPIISLRDIHKENLSLRDANVE